MNEIVRGLRDFWLSPLYLFRSFYKGPIAKCPKCAEARFWHPYALEMNYCHFCGKELIKYEENVL